MKTFETESLTALLFEIQRMSTEDGPGIRTTVFFKGCPLKCAWCHNPESMAPGPQVQWIASRCIGCGICTHVCPQKALQIHDGRVIIDRSRCEACGTCGRECPSTAMELIGRHWEVDTLVQEVTKDLAYFQTSHGGVTLSGGEPSLQARFAAEFMQQLNQMGIHTALDTCGLCSREALGRLLPNADMVLFDIKEMDSAKHEAFTGSPNQRILENLMIIGDYLKSHIRPKSLWIRTPIIPGATARADNIREIGKFIAPLGDLVQRWDLCAFNNLCRDKYLRLDMQWAHAGDGCISQDTMASLVRIAKSSGVNPDIVCQSGSLDAAPNDPEACSPVKPIRPKGDAP